MLCLTFCRISIFDLMIGLSILSKVLLVDCKGYSGSTFFSAEESMIRFGGLYFWFNKL